LYFQCSERSDLKKVDQSPIRNGAPPARRVEQNTGSRWRQATWPAVSNAASANEGLNDALQPMRGFGHLTSLIADQTASFRTLRQGNNISLFALVQSLAILFRLPLATRLS
jgi:hypothetical protein